jgi:PEP-CTERM motif
MQFLTTTGFTTSGIGGGTEDDNGNLNFNGLNIYLAPGTYRITGWVNRPELTGGQWFWDMTNAGAPVGSEFSIVNPGASLLSDGDGNPLAADPTPGSAVYGTSPSDLAFTIYGQSAPEPSGLVLLAIGGVALIFLAWRRRPWTVRVPAGGTS